MLRVDGPKFEAIGEGGPRPAGGRGGPIFALRVRRVEEPHNPSSLRGRQEIHIGVLAVGGRRAVRKPDCLHVAHLRRRTTNRALPFELPGPFKSLPGHDTSLGLLPVQPSSFRIAAAGDMASGLRDVGDVYCTTDAKVAPRSEFVMQLRVSKKLRTIAVHVIALPPEAEIGWVRGWYVCALYVELLFVSLYESVRLAHTGSHT